MAHSRSYQKTRGERTSHNRREWFLQKMRRNDEKEIDLEMAGFRHEPSRRRTSNQYTKVTETCFGRFEFTRVDQTASACNHPKPRWIS